MRALRGNKSSIWIAARDGSQLKPLIQTDRSVGASAFSPDGHWIAYGSNEQKSVNVFVQPFPPTGVKYQLTTENTSTPVWSADGKQLYFVYTNRVFRADVRFANGLTLGPVTELAAASSLPSLPNTRHVDVTPDGKRLLVVVPEGPGGAERTSINVVLNWIEELNAKLPK